LMAATHSDRVGALVIVNGYARVLVDDDYPIGMSAEELAAVIDVTDPSAGAPNDDVDRYVPSAAGDESFRRWWLETGRRGASPATARALLRVALEADVRAALPTIRVPVLVLSLRDALTASGSRYVAERTPDAKLVEVPG